MLSRWKPIPGYPAYEVSDQGEVRSLPPSLGRKRTQGKILKHIIMRDRDHYVGLYCGGSQPDLRKVAVLVLEAFSGPRPEGHYACHRDDDGDNNTLDNLYWGTPLDNERDKRRNSGHYLANRDHCKRGHPWTEASTYIRKDTGTRQCRVCAQENDRRRRQP